MKNTALLFILALTVQSGTGIHLPTIDEEIQLGKKFSEQFESSMPMVQDPAAEKYISALGARIAGSLKGTPYGYTFRIADTGAVNACAVPAGHIYVFRGMVKFAENEAQLASIICHEIIHCEKRHFLRMQRRGEIHRLLKMKNLGGVNVLLLLKYSREKEEESDEKGMELLARAGFDAREMISLYRKMTGLHGGPSKERLSTHPPMQERVRELERHLLKMKLTFRKNGADIDSEEFESVRKSL